MKNLVLFLLLIAMSCNEKEVASPWTKYPITDANGQETGDFIVGAQIKGINNGLGNEEATLVLTLQDGKIFMKVKDKDGNQVKFNNGPTNITTTANNQQMASQIFWTNNVAVDQKGQLVSLLRLHKEVEVVIDEAARNPASKDKFTFKVKGIDQ